MRSYKVLGLVLAFIVVLLAACGPTDAPPSPSPPPATARPARTAVPTTPPTPRPTGTPVPTYTPYPTRATRTPAATYPPGSTFQSLPPAQGRPEGNVRDMRVAPDGTLWLVTEEAVGSLYLGIWTLHFDYSGILVGFDQAGRTWLAVDDGSAIAAWDGTTWTSYGPEAGWSPLTYLPLFEQTFAQGYEQVFGETMVTDQRGWVWLTTGQDVRAFDGQGWTVYGAEDIGFTTPPEGDVTLWLADVALDSSGNVWVGECDWRLVLPNAGPDVGQGARWFTGQEWQGEDSPVVGAGCVMDMEPDGTGSLWVGVDDELWRYTLAEGWTLFPSSFEPSYGIFGPIFRIDLAPGGDLWLTYYQFYGSGALYDDGYSLARFRLVDDSWFPFGGYDTPESLLFDAAGTPWICNGTVLQVKDDMVDFVTDLAGADWIGNCFLEVDPAGRIWAALSGMPSLWVYGAEGGE